MDYSLSELKELCKGFTVLYTEDDKETQSEMAKILDRIFETVYIASDGEEAIKMFNKMHPSLVISDIQMPKKNGLELTAHIKTVSHDVPVIITTAFNEESYF